MPGASPYDVLLFDLGGVIIELAGVPTFREWTREELSDEQIWERWLRSSAVRRFESGRSGAEEFARAVVEEFELSVPADTFLAHFERWPTAPYPGALELLSGLRERFRVACLSNCNELHWPRFLGEMELGPAFDHHFASHELGVLKPDREVFERVAAELGCGVERVLFLDDNELNVTGARDVGMQAHRVQGVEAARRLLAELGLL